MSRITTYAELQAAIVDKLENDELTNSTDQFIQSAEAKINRKVNALDAERQATSTYDSSNTDRLVSLPSSYRRMMSLKIKPSSAADSEYRSMTYVSPERIQEYYQHKDPYWYTLRRNLEINTLVSSSYQLLIHYNKRWDIATDSTNWLLTNNPDLYLYGACVEAEAHMVNDARIPLWKSLFEEAINEINGQRVHDIDLGVLDTSHVASLGSNTNSTGYNIIKGSY